MTEEKVRLFHFDKGSLILGILLGMLLLCIIVWIAAYIQSGVPYHEQTFWCGFIGGAGITYCLTRIDWSVGF